MAEDCSGARSGIRKGAVVDGADDNYNDNDDIKMQKMLRVVLFV